MGEFDFEDETVDFAVEQPGDNAGIKNLRKAYAAQKRQIGEIEKRAREAEKTSRSTVLDRLLEKQKVNPKVASLIGSDVEASEAGVKAWLTEYADVFNIKQETAPDVNGQQPQGQEQSAPPVVDVAQQEAWRRAQGTEAQGQQPLSLGLDAAQRVLTDAKGKGFEDVVAALSAQGLVSD